MNEFSDALAALCRSRPLVEKWLVAPNRRAGYQWIDRVAAGGQPVLNLHVHTLRSVATTLAQPCLESTGSSLLRSRGSMFLAGSLFRSLRKDSGGYLLSLRPTPALVTRLARVIEELRLAGLSPERIRGGTFEHELKAHELALLLRGYIDFLEQHKLADFATLLRLASAVATDAGGEGRLIILPAGLEISRLEREMLDAFPAGDVHHLPVDSPEEGYGWQREAGRDFRFGNPVVAPGAEIVRAVGEVNEINQALCRIIAERWPLEQVELIHTQRQTYVPLIYEQLQASLPEELLESGELPVTFAEGIPSSFTRPGRALEAWLGWIGSGLNRAGIAGMIGQGLLTLPQDSEIRASSLLSLISELPVGKGRECWRRALKEKVEALERKAGFKGRDEDGETIDSGAGKLAVAVLLRDIMERLLRITPDPGCDDAALVEGARCLLEDFAAYPNELDSFARRALLDQVNDFRDWIERHGDSGFSAADFLPELAGSVPVMGMSPQPGKIHVSPLAEGGHSGRPVTIVVGLDDGRWPQQGGQNPLLLDKERARLSKELTVSTGRQRRDEREFGLLLARLRGRVILSFPCLDPADSRELFPSPLLLPVYRVLSASGKGRRKDFLNSLPTPGSFAPPSADLACSQSGWWLASMLSLPAGEASSLLAEYYPHLERGRKAASMRQSDQFGEYDGFLAGAPEALNPFDEQAASLSASRLQSAGACPRRYYYRYILSLPEPQEPSPPSQWLDSAGAGLLLHELFQRLLEALLQRELLPANTPEQFELAGELAERLLLKYRSLHPVPGEAAFVARRRWLLQAVRVFLAQEEAFCRTHTPRWFEASIGIRDDDPSGTEIGCPQPVSLLLGDGALRAGGRIDRIDCRRDGGYVVTDYKSGGAGYYQRGKPFDSGRRVQHALYLALVQARLNSIDPGAKAVSFRYFFPAGRERGEQVQWSIDRLAEGRELISTLCRVIGQGVFIATENAVRDCGFCGFRTICGDVDAQAEQSVRMRNNFSNTMLRNVIKVREYG
jgi:RecB family exonuclease